MALVNGNDYDHVDMRAVSGGDVTRHMLKDAQARNSIQALLNAVPIAAKAANAEAIPSGANVNLYITPGNYKVASSTTAGNITGLPGTYPGRLTVITLAAESRVYQVFIRQDLSTGVYVRYASVSDITDPSTAVWTEWKRLVDQDVLNAAMELKADKTELSDVSSEIENLFPLTTKAANAEAIPSGANVNLYITPGNYKVASSTIAGNITGLPGAYPGRLTVITLAAESRVYQVFIRQDLSSGIYVRFATVSDMADPSTAVWTEWKQLVDQDVLNAAMALKADKTELSDVSSEIDNLFPLTTKAANAEAIPSGANANLYITPGNYKVASSTIAGNITGLPGAYPGRLTVITLAAESRVYQVFIRQDLSSGIYVRFATVSDMADPSTAVWTGWKRLVDQDVLDDQLANTATQNTKAGYYLLPKSQYAVGWINSNGDYSSTDKRRICTPNVQTALTDLYICPREGHRIVVRLFDSAGATVTETIAPNDLSPIKLQNRQKYKFYIRKVGEASGDPEVTVNEMYDKAMFFNPLQHIDQLAINGDIEHLPADYGLVPSGVFYPGIADETYNAFSYNTTTSEVYAAFDALVADHGEYITKSDLGLCSDGVQHIYMYDFNPSQIAAGTIYEEIPALFLLCGQHGYEKASVFSAYYLFKHMIDNTLDNPILNYLRNHFRIICIPVANPYGFNEKQYKNYNGVNLNRNWDTEGWGEGEGEQDPSTKDYAGTEPFSEPETRAARDAFLEYKNTICMAIDYHTNGSVNPVPGMGSINAILFPDKMTPIWLGYKKGVRYHIKDITSHFAKQFNLDLNDDEFCGSTIISAFHGGMAGRWFSDQEKLSCIFETFPCFPGQTSASAYSADVIRASEELIGNYIITQLNHTKGL